MRRYGMVGAVWVIVVALALGVPALRAQAPASQESPRAEGVRLLRLGIAPQGVWFVYLIRFDDGSLGVLARLDLGGPGGEVVYFGALLPEGACTLGQDMFLPLPEEGEASPNGEGTGEGTRIPTGDKRLPPAG